MPNPPDEISMEAFMGGQEVPEAATIPDEISMEDFMGGQEVLPEGQRTYKDEDFPEYAKLLKSPNTTPDQVNSWLVEKGYGLSSNVEEVLAFHRAHPDVAPLNTYSGNLNPLTPEGDNKLLTPNLQNDPWLKRVAEGVSENIKGQGGLGLSDNTRAWLGANDSPESPLGRVFQPIQNAPANLVDLAYSASQGIGAVQDSFMRETFGDEVADDPLVQAGVEVGTGLLGVRAIPAGAAARVGDLARKVKKPSVSERLRAEGINPDNLPPGVSPKEAIAAIEQTKKIRDDAARFEGTLEPELTKVFPTDQSRAAEAEAWAQQLGVPDIEDALNAAAGRLPDRGGDPLVEDAATISRREAEAEFAAAQRKKAQTPNQWGKSLEEQVAAYKARQENTAAGQDGATPLPGDKQTPDSPVPAAEASAGEASDVVSRFTAALNTAGPARAEQQELYKKARAERFAQVVEAQKKGGGRKAYEKSLAAMKGELPKADFEPIEMQFTPQEVNELFDLVSESSLSPGSKLSAHSGLEKLLRGNLPQPKELENMADVFPADFVKAAMSNRKAMAKAGSMLSEIWNAPKALQSTADLSAPLRQGLGLIHRGEFWKSLGPMVKAAASSDYSTKLMKDMKLHPNYDAATEAGLSITRVGELGINEDMFRSRWAEKIPVWGKVVRGSEQAFVGFLNKTRFDTFNTMLAQAKDLGHDLNDPAVAKGIARYINVMTGRGGLGSWEDKVNDLNNIVYSPGLISSRLQILTAPVQGLSGKGFIADLPEGMRKEAVKSYAAIIGFNSTALSLAYLSGKDVNLDPLSTDFLKLKDGDTRLDFGGGLQQYIVAGARAYERAATSTGSAGNTRELKRQGDTPLDNDLRFVMNKMHPSLTLFLDQQRGKTTVGEPFEWQKAVLDRIAPMGFPDIHATLKEHGGDPGVFYGFLGLIGAGLSNFHSKGDNAAYEEFKPEDIAASEGGVR